MPATAKEKARVQTVRLLKTTAVDFKKTLKKAEHPILLKQMISFDEQFLRLKKMTKEARFECETETMCLKAIIGLENVSRKAVMLSEGLDILKFSELLVNLDNIIETIEMAVGLTEEAYPEAVREFLLEKNLQSREEAADEKEEKKDKSKQIKYDDIDPFVFNTPKVQSLNSVAASAVVSSASSSSAVSLERNEKIIILKAFLEMVEGLEAVLLDAQEHEQIKNTFQEAMPRMDTLEKELIKIFVDASLIDRLRNISIRGIEGSIIKEDIMIEIGNIVSEVEYKHQVALEQGNTNNLNKNESLDFNNGCLIFCGVAIHSISQLEKFCNNFPQYKEETLKRVLNNHQIFNYLIWHELSLHDFCLAFPEYKDQAIKMVIEVPAIFRRLFFSVYSLHTFCDLFPEYKDQAIKVMFANDNNFRHIIYHVLALRYFADYFPTYKDQAVKKILNDANYFQDIIPFLSSLFDFFIYFPEYKDQTIKMMLSNRDIFQSMICNLKQLEDFSQRYPKLVNDVMTVLLAEPMNLRKIISCQNNLTTCCELFPKYKNQIITTVLSHPEIFKGIACDNIANYRLSSFFSTFFNRPWDKDEDDDINRRKLLGLNRKK